MRLCTFVCSVPVVVWLSACSSLSGFGQQKSDGLNRVDELLACVEQVQVESLVSKERAHAAYGALQTIVGPDFDGDAIAAHAELEQQIEASKDQGKKLAATVVPLERSADGVFERWTADLESFGNTKLRQHSQARMEETRARCDAVLRAVKTAEVAFDAFNADLNDHALFLEHDFNAAAVASIAGAVDGLQFQAQELDRRLDACSNTARSYVQAAALRGEVASEEPVAEPVAQQPAKPAAKSSTLRRKAAAPAPVGVAPAPAPAAPVEAAPAGTIEPVAPASKPVPQSDPKSH